MGELGDCAICGKDASALYPLLSGSPAFCSEHHNPKDAGPFGCDFTGPDDFDIPLGGDNPWAQEYEPVWVDKEGNPYYSEDDIKDDHLVNIVRFLQRKAREAREAGNKVRALALEAKREEMEGYAKQRKLDGYRDLLQTRLPGEEILPELGAMDEEGCF